MRHDTPAEHVVRDHRFLTKNFIVYLNFDKEQTVRLLMGKPTRHRLSTLQQTCFTGEVITKSGDRFHAVIILVEQENCVFRKLGVVCPAADGRPRFLFEGDHEFPNWIRFMQEKYRGFVWQPYAYSLYVKPKGTKRGSPRWSRTWAELQRSDWGPL